MSSQGEDAGRPASGFDAGDALGDAVRGQWLLDDDVVFLNHGSFGAVPRVVLERQAELRERMERQPCRFFLREVWGLLDAARERVAEFVGADPEGLVAVTNTTTGVAAACRTITLSPGDEILVTDHGYGACRHAVARVAERTGARVVTARVPFPLARIDDASEAILAAVTPRTRFALLDHVTSPTAVVLPVERLVPRLADRGVRVMIDGAHAPGQLALDLRALERSGVDFYAANLHKWTCAPKGAAFLHVAERWRDVTVPAVVSHGDVSRRPGRSPLHDRFDWPGTSDPTAFLSAPASIEWLGGLHPDGWPGLRRRNRNLARLGRDLLCDALGIDPPVPEEALAAMASVPLPDDPAGTPPIPPWAMATLPLQDRLLSDHGVEVPVQPWPSLPRRLLRVSCPAYASEADLRACCAALRAELARE